MIIMDDVNTKVPNCSSNKFGRMQISNQPAKVMLVYDNVPATVDSSCLESLSCAAQNAKLTLIKAPLTVTPNGVTLSMFIEHRPEIVFIDTRTDCHQASKLCQILRSVRGTEYTIIIAVIRIEQFVQTDLVKSLLGAGFTRCINPPEPLINGNGNRHLEDEYWVSELTQIIQVENIGYRKLRAAQALLSALDSCTDGIVLTNSEHKIQYANTPIETVFGFPLDELIGASVQNYFQHDSITTEIDRKIGSTNDGGRWSERIEHRRKSGEAMPVWNQILPINNYNGHPEFIVYVKEFPFLFIDKLLNRESEFTRQGLITGSAAYQPPGQQAPTPQPPSSTTAGTTAPIISGVGPTVGGRNIRKTSLDVKNGIADIRRNSLAAQNTARKYNSVSMIDSPSTRVVNMLRAIKDNCPTFMAQTLEQSIEVLKESEVFKPNQFENVLPDNPVASDLFNGLINTNTGISRRMSHETLGTAGNTVQTNKTIPNTIATSALATSTGAPLSGAVPRDMQTLLDTALSWSFDVIRLERISGQRPLVWLGYSILKRFDVCSTLKCSESTLCNWLSLIESNYRPNPYHNSTHAADVMQATAHFLDSAPLKVLFDPLDCAIALIAAIIHDVNHPGRNSAFLCNSSHELAILYNDIAVLESHHAALAFKLTVGPGSEAVNIFQNLPTETYRDVRHSIVDMVLATDMAKHFEHLTKFLNVLQTLSWDASIGLDSMIELTTGTAGSGVEPLANLTKEQALQIALEPFTSEENILLIKRILIKCADVSNPTRPLELCREWAKRIAVEYCEQTDEEKRRSLPVVMPAFDRFTCSIPKSQIGFIDYFANDLFVAWNSFAGCTELIKNMNDNYQFWKKELAKQDSEKSSVS